MPTHSPAAAATPSLRFRPTANAELQGYVRAHLASLERGGKPRARAYSQHGARSVTLQGNQEALEFIGVTERIARDGGIVRVNGIDTTGLASNAPFLWQHGVKNDLPPIGRIASWEKAFHPDLGPAFTFRVLPATPDGVGTEQLERVQTIWALYRQGFMNATSYGWATIEAVPLQDEQGYAIGLEWIRSDALEFSAVNVGSDPWATAVRSGLLSSEMAEELERLQGTPPNIYTIRDLPPQPGDPPPIAPAAEPEELIATPDAVLDDDTSAEAERAATAPEMRPYTVAADHAECPADKPYAVVKAGGDVMGCHESEAAAKKQQAALYANEPRSAAKEPSMLPVTDTTALRAMLTDVLADLMPINVRAGKRLSKQTMASMQAAMDKIMAGHAELQALMDETAGKDMEDEHEEDDERAARIPPKCPCCVGKDCMPMQDGEMMTCDRSCCPDGQCADGCSCMTERDASAARLARLEGVVATLESTVSDARKAQSLYTRLFGRESESTDDPSTPADPVARLTSVASRLGSAAS